MFRFFQCIGVNNQGPPVHLLPTPSSFMCPVKLLSKISIVNRTILKNEEKQFQILYKERKKELFSLHPSVAC